MCDNVSRRRHRFYDAPGFSARSCTRHRRESGLFHWAAVAAAPDYQRQAAINAGRPAAGVSKHGYRIVSGGTDNHLMLVDLRPKEINGRQAQEVLDRVGHRR